MLNNDMLKWERCVWVSHGSRETGLLGVERENVLWSAEGDDRGRAAVMRGASVLVRSCL